jgi:phage-related baseplate assembly protein
MRAHASIVDCAVRSPEPGQVVLYPLTETGLPSAEIKALVLAAASAEDARPICDQVSVEDPLNIPFTVNAALTIRAGFDAAAVRAAAEASLMAHLDAMRLRLGADIVRTQIIAALHVEGVHRVDLVAPNADTDVPEHGWSHADSVTVTAGGYAND